ncbi:hypothetical protein ACFX2I_032055 [Malus domestica]
MKNSERALRSGHQVFHVEDIRGGKHQKLNWDPIYFYPEEERGIIYLHNDPLIVEDHIANFEVRRILVYTGASVNIMFAEAFRALNVAEHLLDYSISLLISFSGDIMQPLRSIHLPFTIGTGPYTATITTNFLLVDCPTAYNVIFGRTGINDLKAMETLSIHEQVIKTSPDEANLNLHGGNSQPDDPRNDSFTQQAQPAEELEKVSISKDYLDHMNTKVFAWSYEDMPGISPDIICHRLSIDPKTKPAMKAEVEKLKGIGFIHEVNYPTWVANVVLVKKNPTKENLLLQKVLLIDSMARCELLSFMDAYSGYNQILMNPPDQEHTAFTTDR